MSAVIASENKNDSAEDRSPRVSMTRMMYVIGMMLPYAIAYILWTTTKSIRLACIAVLSFGAIPSFLTFLSMLLAKESEEYQSIRNKIKLFQLIDKDNIVPVMGTSICWFLYDFTAYGIILAQLDLVKSLFSNQPISQYLIYGFLTTVIATPALLHAYFYIKRISLKWMQFHGFNGLTISCLIFAIINYLSKSYALNISALLFVNFMINWGVALTIYVIPAVIFSAHNRSTLSGLAGALGKLGAIVGVLICSICIKSFGTPITMIICGLISLLGSILTLFMIPPKSKQLRNEVKLALTTTKYFIPCMKAR